MMADVNMKDLEQRMGKAVGVLSKEFAGLRTGRATPGLLDPVMVAAYGGKMPLNQVAGVNAPEPRLLSITVWDNDLVKAVEKAIRESNLGLNPMTEGNVIRAPVPELTGERRVELVKVAGRYAESARIAIRNIRRDGMDDLKKAEKDGDFGKDDAHKLSDQVQKITDDHIDRVDEALSTKEQEITQV